MAKKFFFPKEVIRKSDVYNEKLTRTSRINSALVAAEVVKKPRLTLSSKRKKISELPKETAKKRTSSRYPVAKPRASFMHQFLNAGKIFLKFVFIFLSSAALIPLFNDYPWGTLFFIIFFLTIFNSKN